MKLRSLVSMAVNSAAEGPQAYKVNSNSDMLRVGDFISMYSEDTYGYIYNKSSIHSNLAVYSRQDREKPKIPDPQAVSFQICVANRYKLNKKYRKLKTKSDQNSDDIRIKNQASQAEIGAEAENDDNTQEQKRQRGKKVLYGQVIQLKHSFTGKYIHVSTTQTSHTESSNMKVDLIEYNAKQAQFKLMPRYKVKAEGDIVQVDDQIVLESVKSPGQYLHVSKTHYGSHSVYSTSYELNLSVRQSGFTIYRRYKPEWNDENLLKAGIPLRLFHKEIEAYLCAEGLFDESVAEDVHLRVRQMDQKNPKSLFPSSSAITYWQVELQEGPIAGHIVRWEQQCRFKHMGTRMYLKVDTNTKVTLTDDHMDPTTVFRLHPVIKDGEQIEFETYCRIEHVVSGTWLHAESEEHERKEAIVTKSNNMSMEGLLWTTAVLKKIGVSQEMQYDDAFTLQKVEDDFVRIFNYMAGMVPVIQKLITDKKAGLMLNAKLTHDIVTALGEMKNFMVVNGVPNKQRQKLLRNLRIVELLVKLLQTPYRGSSDQHHMKKVLVECYDCLYVYLMGDSRKNELYMAKHIDYFGNQVSHEGEIGLNAAHMVMELVKDNRKIVDRITHEHIDNFVGLLRKNKNYRYLDLLSVLCVCDGVSIPDNQKYITEVWLMQGQKNCVYHTELGQAIGKDSNVVYVSKDNKRTWKTLHDFTQGKDFENDQEFLFLDHQLDLFGKLCYGRNEFAIKVITEELGYLTWKEAYLCLTSDELPDQLRAKYCHLIISLFVDVGENMSVLDRINLTFVYDEIGHKGQSTEEEENAAMRARSETIKYFPQIRDWISRFLDGNKDMTASLVGHNMLIEQVLRLVHYLVKYGYYGDIDDIKKLLVPLLSLLDGRNDKPYPKQAGVPIIQDVLDAYRRRNRYLESPETKAICDAKHQAMEVLDLFFNMRFNIRLEMFVGEFKRTHNMYHHQMEKQPELGPLLHDDFDIYESSSMNSLSVHLLEEKFQESSYFADFPITAILLDLSHYNYDRMVTQSMMLMDRYYSSYDNLFKRAVQAQVIITDKSVDVLNELRKIIPVMNQMVSSKLTQDQTKVMTDILQTLIGFCSLENEPEERHPMNQSILFNHGILATVFDILSQEIDIKLIEQYSGIRSIFQKCFALLKAMARGNEVVQQRLFDRLDMLLNIKGAEAEMAEALIEVFTGNKTTCMKVLPHQVQRIMTLASTHLNKAPQFLDLLNSIVKVEELNLPLKRNQGYVMKYFMQYRSEVAYVIDQPASARKTLLTGKPSPDLHYMVSLVDLLATCAEGENRFIESICQTIFSVDELLDIMTSKDIDNNLKRSYLRFFLWVYLNTAGGMIESGSGDLPHDKRVWAYVDLLKEELNELTGYVKGHIDLVKKLLKKAPGKRDNEINLNLGDPNVVNDYLSEEGGKNHHKHHGSLHYLFDAVMPFLQVFFHTYYAPDSESNPEEADKVDQLANALITFTDITGPLISNATHMKTMVGCMNVILSNSTLPVKAGKNKVMEDFQEKYGGAVKTQDIRGDARKRYEEYYSAEEDLNNQLNVFAINYSVVYGGFNDVKTQLGFHSDNEYTEVGGDEELPLGPEFQNHIHCFVDDTKKNAREKYKLTGKLVQQLSISAAHTQMNEKDRLKQEQLDIKCLQLLRGIVHNQIVKLPDDWELNISANKKRLKIITDAQSAIDKHGALLESLDHLASPNDKIVREVLSFTVIMLQHGNESAQHSLEEYFLGTREEKFFFAVKNRMNMSAIATKEKRSLIAQHQAKIEEAVEQAKALRKAMKSGQIASEQIRAANAVGSMLLDIGTSRASKLSKSRTALNRGTPRGSMRKKKTSSQALKKRYGSQHLGGSSLSLNKSRTNMDKSQLIPMLLLDKQGDLSKQGLLKKDDKQSLLLSPVHQNNNKVSPHPQESPQIVIDDFEEDMKEQEDAKDLDDRELRELAALTLQDDGDELDHKDDGYIELVLKILGLMCDGQNRVLQDYLREQPDNIKSVNLVAETSRFLQLLYSSINSETISLVTELFNTLIEFTSGNIQNQIVVFDNKVIDYINFILRGGQFQNCDLKMVLELKCAIATLITALTEENIKKTNDKSTQQKNQQKTGLAGVQHPHSVFDVMESLDADSIYQVAIDCFNKAQLVKLHTERMGRMSSTQKREYKLFMPRDANSRTQQEMRESLIDVGFRYFHVLCRMKDLDETKVKRNKLVKTIEEDAAWNYFENGTLSIELLMNDQLQKYYFRCKDKTVLREDVKELFKYEVDRSSPSNKLREFMDWSKDIMADIKYTRKVLANPFSRFFVKFWWHFNIFMMLISFLFLILIMIFWRANEDTGVIKPNYAYDETSVEIATYVLGVIHNILALCVLISYFIINHPTLPTLKEVKGSLKTAVTLGLDDDDDDEFDDTNERESNLEVKFFSFKTFWYLLLFITSILGTIFYGYFFSFHLLHMANFNQLLLRAIQAVTKNGYSLLWVFIYGLVFLHIYGLLAFAFLRVIFDNEKNGFCEAYYECMFTSVRRGLIDGLFNDEFLEVPAGKPFTFHLYKALFDVTFFIIITTIGLNIIFGIIVDTFSELRDNKWNVDNDMHSTCFICSRNSYDFEHQGGGFEHHVKREHNQWAYLFFFIHLDETRPNDYTALELYVSRLLERENYDFFPLNRALTLQHEEDTNELRLETLMTQVSFLVNKMKEEEAIKVKAIERARQDEWEKQHAVEIKKEPYNPFQGMKRQATILAQQTQSPRAGPSAQSPRQPPTINKPEGQTASPAASLQRAALKVMIEENKQEPTPSPPPSPPPS